MVKTEKEPGIIKETLQSINRYWFDYGSPTSLGLFRICMSGLTVISLLMLSLDWDGWYSERGFVPAWLGARYIGVNVSLGLGTKIQLPIIGILNQVTDPRITFPIFVATILAGIFTVFGLWTRVSSILFAIGVVSIQHRNAAILYGGDTVMRVGVLYLAIAPSGAACSLDRLIGIWKGRISKEPVLISMWPQRLISYNVALLYLTTTWLKWGGGRWQDGTATYYPARLAEFYRFPVPKWINDFPMVYITTYGTLATEFALGTLVFFKPLRKYVLICGVLMHAHIELSMNVPLFSYLMISTYLTFYEGDEVSAWARRLGQRLKKWSVEVHLPADKLFTRQGALFFDCIDPLKLVDYEPGKDPDWKALDSTGREISPKKAIRSRSVGSWLFSWFPGLLGRILAKSITTDPHSSKSTN